MKKAWKGAVCLSLCAMMGLSFVGCKKNPAGQQNDPETRALRLSTSALDGNFNPFFYTSQNDGNIASMTQITMLTSDEHGNPVCGDNQACVVKAYTTQMYDRNGQPTNAGDEQGSTEYEFVIKNGIKFSDGTPLTIKDVLFNLYVYLDPAYTGSSTIYSTDIKGMRAYRQQDESLLDDDGSGDSSDFEQVNFYQPAMVRIQALKDWGSQGGSVDPDGTPSDASLKADYLRVAELYLEELERDWNSVATSWAESYKESYNFHAAWEAYLFTEGIVSVQRVRTAQKTEEQKDANGKFLTTLDKYVESNTDGEPAGTRGAIEHIKEIVEATSNVTVAEYMAANGLDESDPADIDTAVAALKAAASSSTKVTSYMSAHNCTADYAIEQLQRQAAINILYRNMSQSGISNILTYWGTATNALNDFAAQEKTNYYATHHGVKTISGITTRRTSTFNGASLGEEHDVLKIVINGVDPKAIWNFSFTVAPLHYYSGEFNGVNYVTEFNADPNVGNFGVKLGDYDFFQQVLQDPAKNALPMGAGPYKAAKSNNEAAGRGEGTSFFENNIVYFMRNDNFTTLGSGIENAKIKYVRYQVIPDDKLLANLQTGDIDYATPNATPNNRSVANSDEKLATHSYRTGGYGYVGINPKYVPDVAVRRAIMKSMAVTDSVSYYGDLAQPIYRPMSSTSWAYPAGCTAQDAWKFGSDAEITALVESVRDGGQQKWVKNQNGIYQDRNGNLLKFTFTIAGETKEHPAWHMFENAARRLNQIGFDITVSTDIQALKKLSTGGLQIWAAAWSSGIDPDPYQIYHKDSKATSVNNWNYPEILNNASDWSHEYNTIMALSEKIEEGRKYLTQTERKPIYSECLDLIMDLAVELPTYQRSDLCVWNKNVIDEKTLFIDAALNFNMGPISKIWEVNYV